MAPRNCQSVIIATGIGLLALAPIVARAQEPTGLQAAVAIESALVEAIAKAERSVVAIARSRKSADASPAADLLGGFGDGGDLLTDPTRPDHEPHDFGSGVLVDPRGFILTT